MESLKQKMIEVKARIDEARDRAENAEREITIAKDRMESAEERACSLNRRIKMTQMELEKILGRLGVDEKKLERAENVKNSNKQEIATLAAKDHDDVEIVEELEGKVKSANAVVNESQLTHESACRKYKVVEHHKSQVEKRLERAQNMEKTLSAQLKDMTTKIDEIRSPDHQLGHDENELRQQVHSLKLRCNEADMHTEAAQRKAQRLTQDHATLEGEMASLRAKKAEAMEGLEIIMNDIGGM